MKGIYKYTDLKNGDIVYVGKDSHIDKHSRHKTHLRPSEYNGQPFNRVLQNNPNRYEYGVIWATEDCTNLKLNKMEILFGKIYNPKFNFDKFGKGGCNGHTEETIQKIIKSNLRKDLDDDVLAKEYFENGLNIYEIGEKYNCDPTTVSHRLKKNGYKLRDICEAQNTTGYYRVTKQKSKTYKQGFVWRYQYSENGKKKAIISVDIKKLEKKVKAKRLEWREL